MEHILRADALQGVRLGYKANTNALFTRALNDLRALGATLVPVEDREADSISLLEIGLIPNEFKFGINRYLAQDAGPGLPVRDLTDIILFNQQHPDEVQYGQDLLIASDATPGLGPLGDASALPVIAANRALADLFFSNGGVAAIVGLNAPYTGLGAAAGYPTVVVPAGYVGGDPRGLSFFGPAWSEAELLGYAFAYEQATHRRAPPTDVNPSLLDGVCNSSAPATPAPPPAPPHPASPAPRAPRLAAS